jgi:hypothetical protein
MSRSLTVAGVAFASLAADLRDTLLLMGLIAAVVAVIVGWR